jgi:hypothetical protein
MMRSESQLALRQPGCSPQHPGARSRCAGSVLAGGGNPSVSARRANARLQGARRAGKRKVVTGKAAKVRIPWVSLCSADRAPEFLSLGSE